MSCCKFKIITIRNWLYWLYCINQCKRSLLFFFIKRMHFDKYCEAKVTYVLWNYPCMNYFCNSNDPIQNYYQKFTSSFKRNKKFFLYILISFIFPEKNPNTRGIINNYQVLLKFLLNKPWKQIQFHRQSTLFSR